MTLAMRSSDSAHRNPDWWRGAAIYQIYPRSFADSNGDGVGDLEGILGRLDYVAGLGVDAIWLSPFFKSPMKDFGYDVSDYRDVDPLFGTLEGFERLVEGAHTRGLHVMIDQVISHSSDQHPWFKESRSSRVNAKADWYVWADARDDGTPPNNWISIFGGSAWAWDPVRRQYYLHNFLKSQPDLNFHNPAVQAAVLDVLGFWLDLGVDGFRLDTANYYFHDAELRSNPSARADVDPSTGPPSNPYFFQDHIYDKTRPENLPFIEKVRQLLDQYPGAAAVGELGVDSDIAATMAQYTRRDKRLHMAYSFQLLTPNFSTSYIRKVVEEMERGIGDGWPAWAFSNHDVARVVSRWKFADAGERAAPVLTALLGSLRGSICIYQGEELGLTEAEIPFEKLQDPYGIEFWPDYKGRDGCRTPMPWTDEAPNAGFTASGKEPWLPVSPEHLQRAASRQQQDPASALGRTRRFLKWRSQVPALLTGTIRFLDLPEPLLGIVREEGAAKVVAVFNLGAGPQTLDLGAEASGLEPCEASGFSVPLHGSVLHLGGLDAFFGRRGKDAA